MNDSCLKCSRTTTTHVVTPGGDGGVCCGCGIKEKKEDIDNLRVIRLERLPLRIDSTTLVGVHVLHQFSGPCEKCGRDHAVRPRYRGSVTTGFICCEQDCGGRIPIVDPYPLNSGNCCSLSVGRRGPSYRCRNMNSENVIEAAKRWPELTSGVDVEVLEDGSCRVVDERLPIGWRRHFCPSCGYFEDPKAWERFVTPNPTHHDSSKIPNSTRKGNSELESGIVYLPYRIEASPPVVDPADFNIDPTRLKKIRVINSGFFGEVDLSGPESSP